jgi:hypothetical protein
MPSTHAPVRFSDAYPDEFAEWSDIFEQENMTPQHQCMAAIIADPAVMHAAKAVIDSILADESERWSGEDRLTRLDAMWQFFDRASHLPEEQPPGSHLRSQNNEPLAFSSPDQLRQGITSTAAKALELAALLRQTATAIGDVTTLDHAPALVAQLEDLHDAALMAAHTYLDHPLPGARSWKQWLQSRLAVLSIYHLRENHAALIAAVRAALIAHEEGRRAY